MIYEKFHDFICMKIITLEEMVDIFFFIFQPRNFPDFGKSGTKMINFFENFRFIIKIVGRKFYFLVEFSTGKYFVSKFFV